jgi:Ca2+-transporting ATPase
VKGAPESLLPTLLPGEESVQLEELAQSWGAEGIRVLLVARRPNLPAKADPECELEAVGLIGVSDPPRAAAAASVAAARRAGVRTVMITGDQPQTALAIARATGITTDEHPAVMSTGPQIDSLSDGELRDRSRSVNVYARVAPEHKLRIVEALKSQEEVVAMTGDGVNDVPALKAAHIGIAMGRRGSDAATAAADMVLIDDDYSTIVAAIRRGRVIYDNIVRFVHFLLSANAGEVLVFTVAIVVGMSAPLTVLQVLTVNLLTDGLPAVALGGDPPSPNIMERKPRPLREGLLDSIRSRLLIGGAAMGVAAFASFAVGEASAHALGQTMAFTTLVFGQLIYVFSVRGDRWFFEAGQNRALYAAVAITAAVQVAILAIPSVAHRFDVVGMSASHVSIALALALLPASILELVKWRSRARMGQ